ncbi:MAG: acyl carrier protein [Candidatus Epulonipiscioides saccharophilum]|nr:MAG: acyl carrier protein [Epulopiscium sp. AS2M-Bin001]
MNNDEKYLQVFMAVFEIGADEAQQLNYNDIEDWDSVGHFNLINELEEAFDIMMETDDIVDFSSFAKGKEILAEKYDVVF